MTSYIAAERHPTRGRKSVWRPLALAAAIGSTLVITGFGAWASLRTGARAQDATGVEAGTLSLRLAEEGAGFTQEIERIAPSDAVNRFVTLTNDGSLTGRALSVRIAATPGADGNRALIDDGTSTRALRIAMSSCPVPWEVTRGVPTCEGASGTTVLAPTVLSALATAAPLDMDELAATGGRAFLRIAVTLPDQTETTVDGTTAAQTVQGASAALAYTFIETQRAGEVSTDSRELS